MGKSQEAIQWLERSIDIKQQIGDKPGLSYGYLNLGSIYYFDGIDKEKGIEFTQKAFDNASEIKDNRMMVYALADLSTMYLEQKQFEAAKIFSEKGMSLVGNDPAYDQAKSGFLKNMAVIENEANNFDKAYELAKEALALHPPDVLSGQPDIYFEMFTAQKGMGNIKSALQLHEKYAALMDSLNKLEKTEKVAEIDAKYQAAEKDKAIALLEKDKLLSLAEIDRRKAQLLYVALVALIILGIASWAFLRNRYKHALEMERMRTRIASDLHDEVGSSLSHLNFLIGSFDLENAPDLTAKGIERSKELMRKTASNIRDVVWAIDARRDKTGDLLDRMEDFAFDMFSVKNIACRFQTEGMNREAALNPFVRQNIFLIFKETINNIAKHSNATEVRISLSQKGGSLELTVADNGTNATSNGKPATGLGLENMQMRAKRIGGTVKIEPGSSGFVVHLLAPLALQ
jgi:signal transduction histidine kinase